MDDLVKRLREVGDRNGLMYADYDTTVEAASRIEKLEAALKKQEAITKADTDWLKAYHKWCEMNGCAPSSSDLITARAALAGEKSDD